MGLLRAGIGAAAGVLSEQWRDYIYCDSIPNNVLMVKGRKRTGGNDNLLSDGSIIAVNEGQCMLIVHQGAVVDLCAEAGEFLFEGGSEPSVFYGDLGEQVKATFLRIGERFAFGGDAANDLRYVIEQIAEGYDVVFNVNTQRGGAVGECVDLRLRLRHCYTAFRTHDRKIVVRRAV